MRRMKTEKDTKAQQGDCMVNEQQEKVATLWENVLLLCFMDIQVSYMITENFKWRKRDSFIWIRNEIAVLPSVAALLQEATRAAVEDWREVQVSITQDEMYTIIRACGLCKAGAASFLSQVLT